MQPRKLEPSGPPPEIGALRAPSLAGLPQDTEFAPRAIFTAYLRGTVQWPQIRGGANIHITAALFAESGWSALGRYVLSEEQVSQSLEAMRVLHERAGIRTVPVELIKADWEKAIAVAGAALAECKIENPRESSFCRKASAAAKEILDSLGSHSHLFVASFWSQEKIQQESRSPSRRTIESLTKLQLERDLLQDQKLMRHMARTAAASALREGLEDRFPREDINWLLTDFKL